MPDIWPPRGALATPQTRSSGPSHPFGDKRPSKLRPSVREIAITFGCIEEQLACILPVRSQLRALGQRQKQRASCG